MTLAPDPLLGATPQGVYRDLFQSLYGVDEPVVRLRDVIHWIGPARALGLGGMGLNDERAFFAAGYFYGVHTPSPCAAEIDAALEAASAARAAWVVYPLVPSSDDSNELAARGFVRLPWFIESRYQVRRGVEPDLRDQLGGERLKKIRRNARRVSESYDTEVVVGPDIVGHGSALSDFDRLHALNILKYQHARNHFGARAVEALLRSPLAPHVVLFFKRERATGRAVEASLNLVDRGGRHLIALVQGIDHGRVPPSFNLYTANHYDRYLWGVERGIATFNLGRGGEHTKLRIGANAFVILDIHIRRTDGAPAAELYPLRATAGAAVTAQWQRVMGDDAPGGLAR